MYCDQKLNIGSLGWQNNIVKCGDITCTHVQCTCVYVEVRILEAHRTIP